MVESLSRPPVALLYIVANLALGFHLFHGAWSMFQSLGLNHPPFNRWRRWFAYGFTAVVVAGNLSFPIMVQLGVIDEDNRAPATEQEAHGPRLDDVDHGPRLDDVDHGPRLDGRPRTGRPRPPLDHGPRLEA